ncbi:MAG TPA: DUF5818 domain-containing protein [Candidatus Acidoferrum sp.]|nr:DUF5818 domain-containing protein [Candidatus Acidoferrum sp.]
MKNQGAKSARFFPLVVATLLLTAVLPLAALAGPSSHPPGASKPQAQNRIQGTLLYVSGTICKGDEGEYLLRDASSGGLFWLDDQDLAAKFLGEAVSITGVLDAPNNLIRILSIHSAH